MQLTSFEKHPVRFLSIAENGKMSFSYDGDLYTYEEGQEPKKLEIHLKTQGIANRDKFQPVNGEVREMSIAPNGKEIAFISRGEVFVTSVDGTLTKRIPQPLSRRGLCSLLLMENLWSMPG
jgi:tricorn protease